MSTAPVDVSGGSLRSRDLAGWLATGAVALLVAAFLAATPTWLTTMRTATDARPILLAAAAVSTGAVVIAHRWPLPATLVSLLPFLIVPWTTSWVFGWLLGVLGVMVVAAARSWRAALPAWGAAAVIVGAYTSHGYPAALPIGWVTSGGEHGFATLIFLVYLAWHTAALVVAAAVGNGARSRERARRASATERRALEVETVVAERARTARDLHDVVAHHVSLIAVRAESAPYQHPGLDADARAVLAAIATDARTAISELRGALTILRRADTEAHGTAPGPEVERRPQPTLDDVQDLIEQARDAGQRIEVAGTWPPVPAPHGYALYRAVQEGLTNARRHAPGEVVALHREHSGGRVGFTMANPTRRSETASPTGRGLLGMRERVTALEGTMEVDAGAGQFVLHVDVPLEELP